MSFGSDTPGGSVDFGGERGSSFHDYTSSNDARAYDQWGGGLMPKKNVTPNLYVDPVQEEKYEQAYKNIYNSEAMPAEKDSAWDAYVRGQEREDTGFLSGAKFGLNEFRSALPKINIMNNEIPIGAALLSQTPFKAPAAGLMTLAGALGGKSPDYVVGEAGLPVGQWQEKDDNKDGLMPQPQQAAQKQEVAQRTAQKIGLQDLNIMDILKAEYPYQAALDYITKRGLI